MSTEGQRVKVTRYSQNDGAAPPRSSRRSGRPRSPHLRVIESDDLAMLGLDRRHDVAHPVAHLVTTAHPFGPDCAFSRRARRTTWAAGCADPSGLRRPTP